MNEVIYSVGMSLEYLERLVILKAMGHFRGNKMATAASLGIDRRTLDHRLDKYADEDNKHQERLLNEQSKREEFLARARGNPPNNLGIPYNPNSEFETERTKAGLSSAITGSRMEPAPLATSKQTMSMPKRVEVQTVLQNKVTKGSKDS